MNRGLIIIFIFVIIIIIVIGGVLFYQKSVKKPSLTSFSQKEVKEQKLFMEKLIENKKIAMVIAFRDFRDEEYFVPKQTLESAGAIVKTVSTSLGKAIGKLGGEANVDILLSDLNVSDYDAVLFVGGPGAFNYIEDKRAHQIARETVENEKILGAICIAPAILAKAGVLDGKRATVWSSLMDKSAVKILKENGAEYEDRSVVVDGKIVTASGPQSAKEFAQKIIELLQ